MIKKTIVIMALFLLVFSTISYAQNSSIGLRVSTLGAGIEADRSFSDSTGARVGFNYFTADYSAKIDDIDYDLDLNLMSVSVLLDWHPFKGSFRISGGAPLKRSPRSTRRPR